MTLSKKDRLKIIQHILNGIEEYWLDQSGIIYATNLEAIMITGYEEREIIGNPLSVLYLGSEVATGQPEKDIARTLATGAWSTKGVRIKKNKINFLAKITFDVMMRENGEPGLKMTLQDTTYKAIQKHKLKQAELHFDSLFHNGFIGVLHVNQENLLILLGNRKAMNILGIEEVEGHCLGDFVRTEQDRQQLLSFIQSGNRDDFELTVLRTDQSFGWLRMQCTYFSDEKIVEVLLFDVSSERKTIEELERINHHLDQFIYHASHDLRAPLTTLLGLLNISKKEISSPASIGRYIELMIERTRHLDSLLIDLTSIAYNEKALLQLDELDLKKELDILLTEHRALNESIHYEVTVQQPFSFYTDAKRLRSILRNLVSNAVKYYNPAQRSPYINVLISVSRKHASIEVIDNGIGIHPQHIDKIFTMFYRATDRSSGSGLGLYLVKAMVAKLNGELKVVSTPHSGSAFSVVLPNLKN